MHAQRQGAGRGEEERRERSGHVNLLLESGHIYICDKSKFSACYSVALECGQKYFQLDPLELAHSCAVALAVTRYGASVLCKFIRDTIEIRIVGINILEGENISWAEPGRCVC